MYVRAEERCVEASELKRDGYTYIHRADNTVMHTRQEAWALISTDTTCVTCLTTTQNGHCQPVLTKSLSQSTTEIWKNGTILTGPQGWGPYASLAECGVSVKT